MIDRTNYDKPQRVEIETEEEALGALSVRSVLGRESISQLYRYEVIAASTVPIASGPKLLHPDDVVGQQVALRFVAADGQLVKLVDGLVTAARRRVDEGVTHAVYELEVSPQAFRLSLVETQAIHHDVTVPQVIRAKLERHRIRYQERLIGEYPQRELIVQYRETDLSFVQRIAEHAGISFFFDCDEDGELLVVTDHPGGFATLDERHPIAFDAGGEKRGVTALQTASVAVAKRYVVVDYNYRNPTLDMAAMQPLERGLTGGVVEYGSHHKTPLEGQTLALLRAQEAECRRSRVSGTAYVGLFSAGLRIVLDGHPIEGRRELLLTEVTHRWEIVGEDDTYEVSYAAVSSSSPYRPPLVTPRPRIDGVVTAMVQVNEAGDDQMLAILDEHGRYFIQFHFDTTSYGTRAASHPVRQAQPFNGPRQGMHFPLRPGTEVLVAFVDGDPDRPIIVGALPNHTTPSQVVAADSHMHRITSHHGLVIEFGRSS